MLLFSRLIQGEFGPSVEFPEGGPAAIRNLDTDPFLRIQARIFTTTRFAAQGLLFCLNVYFILLQLL
jgi:hypothetical protein